jgi:hypothetical protein
MRYIDSVTMPGTRVTESDCGKPEDELSELVRPGYSTIFSLFKYSDLQILFGYRV